MAAGATSIKWRPWSQACSEAVDGQARAPRAWWLDRWVGSLLVAGVSSDAGKSVLTAGICRWLYREGVAVAPFKAMNMSNNSVVTPDGGEIGRAQGAQAAACGLVPETAMNPVLIKPGGEQRSHVVLRGWPLAEADGRSYLDLHATLKAATLEAYDELAARFGQHFEHGGCPQVATGRRCRFDPPFVPDHANSGSYWHGIRDTSAKGGPWQRPRSVSTRARPLFYGWA